MELSSGQTLRAQTTLDWASRRHQYGRVLRLSELRRPQVSSPCSPAYASSAAITRTRVSTLPTWRLSRKSHQIGRSTQTLLTQKACILLGLRTSTSVQARQFVVLFRTPFRYSFLVRGTLRFIAVRLSSAHNWKTCSSPRVQPSRFIEALPSE